MYGYSGSFQKFIERNKSPERHRGHVVSTQYPEIEDSETLSVEEQEITPMWFLDAAEKRGMLNFSLGGDTILVDTTDFSKVSYEAVVNEIKEKLMRKHE
jgi:putative NADH-flavin reductase